MTAVTAPPTPRGLTHPARPPPPRKVPPCTPSHPTPSSPLAARSRRGSAASTAAATTVLTPDGTVRVTALPPLARRAGDADRRRLGRLVDGTAAVARLPRTSLLARGTPRRRATVQPLAANVDVVLVCAGLHADLPVRRVERLLTLAWDSGATPVLVLTKADLCADVAAAARQTARGTRPGSRSPSSRRRPATSAGWRRTPGRARRWSCSARPAPASPPCVNALAGEDLMATGEARQVDGKGRHTTTHRELFTLPSGAVVIDTPGPARRRAAGRRGGPRARPSPTSRSWPSPAGSPTARTRASRAARCRPAWTRATWRASGSTPGAGCSASSPSRPAARTPGCAARSGSAGSPCRSSSGPAAAAPEARPGR